MMYYNFATLSQKAVRVPPHTMPLTRLTAPPPFVAPEAHEELQHSTPKSFSDIPPVLLAELSDVVIKLQPVPKALMTDPPAELVLPGRVWVTEQSLSFLPAGSEQAGFEVSFPSIALHAVSRSVPEDMTSTVPNGASYHQEACIYCQLDDHPERDEAEETEEEEDDAILELWLAVRDGETCT